MPIRPCITLNTYNAVALGCQIHGLARASAAWLRRGDVSRCEVARTSGLARVMHVGAQEDGRQGPASGPHQWRLALP